MASSATISRMPAESVPVLTSRRRLTVSIRSPPLAVFERPAGEEEEEEDRRPVIDQVPAVDDAPVELLHVAEEVDVAQGLLGDLAVEQVVQEADQEQHGDQHHEGHDRGQQLALGERREEHADRQEESAEAEDPEVTAGDRPPVDVAGARDDAGIGHRRHPQRAEEGERREVLADDHLGLGDRGGHQHLDRAAAQLLGDQAHGEHRRDEAEDDPEEEALEELIHRPFGAATAGIVEDADDGGEDDTVVQQEEEQHQVGERRHEVGAQLAQEGGPQSLHDGTSELALPAAGRGGGGGGPASSSTAPLVLPASIGCSWVVRRTKTSSSEGASSASSSSTQPRSTAARKTSSRGSAVRSHSSTKLPGPPAPERTARTPASSCRAAAAPAGASFSVTRRLGLPTHERRRLSGVPSAAMRPRSMMMTRSQSSSTSGRMWVDSSSVRSRPSSRISSRMEMICFGSRPTVGSSRTSTPGRCRMAVASPTRWR